MSPGRGAFRLSGLSESTQPLRDTVDHFLLVLVAIEVRVFNDPDLSAAGIKTGVYPADCFGYDAAHDVWVCPANQVLMRQVTAPGATGRPSKHRYLAAPPTARPVRKAIVDPVFSQFKENRGFTTLRLRGLALATGEYLLACLAHNRGKLLRAEALAPARIPA